MNPNSRELAPAVTIEIPSRWALPDHNAPRATVLKEVDHLCEKLETGVRALQGLYARVCDVIRTHNLSEKEIRPILAKHFPPPRVSDILRLARAPEDVYSRYRAGFFGFKAALHQCRLYHITPSKELRIRKMRRTADRLITLAKGEPFIEIKTGGWTVTLKQDAVVAITAEAVA